MRPGGIIAPRRADLDLPNKRTRGFGQESGEWRASFERERDDWEREYAEAHDRWEAHGRQVLASRAVGL